MNAVTPLQPVTETPQHWPSVLEIGLWFYRRSYFVISLKAKNQPYIKYKHLTAKDKPDEAQIRTWFQRWPDAWGVAVLTGERSGMFALDVDNKDGKNGSETLAALEAEHSSLPEGLTFRTPSGGFHHHFLMPPGVDIRNSVDDLGDGLDIRGNGGYVAYSLDYALVSPEDAPVPEAPPWLVEMALRASSKAKSAEPALPREPVPYRGTTHPYAKALLERECEKVASAIPGIRNHTLNIAALKNGHFVGAGHITREECEVALFDAAERCDYAAEHGEAATWSTIASGLDKGISEPKDPPLRVGAESSEKSLQYLNCVNIFDFLHLNFPTREMLLSPILARQGLCMLHAMRGIGKTFVALFVAYVVACGGKLFDRWEAQKPARVLFIDGEMPAILLQERLFKLVVGSELRLPDNDYLRLLTPDMQDGPMPNLATPEGQGAVEPLLAGVDLVVMDNLVTLARHGRANDEESWLPVQAWLLGLRRRGISVLMIHHQGKTGDQRGTSAKEDILDTVIRLDRPKDYRSEQGARFEVHLTKARGIYGADVKPFEAQLITKGSALTWETKEIEDAKLEQLRQLLADGYSIRDAAKEMDISKSAVDRLKRKLEALGADAQGTDCCPLEASPEQYF
ncbi:MAG: bifunctional DNA primase/polymerase [Betaproteobacteria bacterium]|nr:bifunctional DNA primase/polymerase [Betaproteobacteria bacterium]